MIEGRVFMALVTIAISFIGYFLRRQVAANDNFKDEIDDLKVRVAVTENDMGHTNRILESMQNDIRYIVTKVDDIVKGDK